MPLTRLIASNTGVWHDEVVVVVVVLVVVVVVDVVLVVVVVGNVYDCEAVQADCSSGDTHC